MSHRPPDEPGPTETAGDSTAEVPDPTGDPEALTRAMVGCRAYLLTVAGRELESDLAPKAGASDLVQETFLEAQRDLASFRGRTEGELRRWLRVILRHNLANLVRRYRTVRKRRTGREVSLNQGGAGDAVKLGLASPSPSPSGAAIRQEDQARLLDALGRLAERDRLLIVWRSQEDCSWDEIGRRLGANAAAARKAWSRAVHRLRDRLGDPPPSHAQGAEG